MTEIRDHGATSTQVGRRLQALLDGLLATIPRPPVRVRDDLGRLDAAVEVAFPDPVTRSRTSASDWQGIGGSRAGQRTTGQPAGSQS